jgi:hypothetical protein
MLPSNHVLDLIPGYALDCLGEQEKRQVAEHLKDCASCTRQRQSPSRPRN